MEVEKFFGVVQSSTDHLSFNLTVQKKRLLGVAFLFEVQSMIS